MAPARWTAARSSYRFERLPAGPARLVVEVWGHHAPVRVSVAGVEVGHVAPGLETGSFEIAVPRSGAVDVVLDVEPFAARGGRRLGTQLRRLTLVPARRLAPSISSIGLLAAPGVAALALGTFSGLGFRAAITASSATTFAITLLLWPGGLFASPYAGRLALAGSLSILVLGPITRRFTAPPLAFAALLSALIVQGALSTHPMLITFDETFHANRLASVARGELLQTSLTQHDPPIAFPYGFTFYAGLAPLVGSARSLVDIVRLGAAASGVVAVMATYAIAARASAATGLLAALLLQWLPWSFVVFPNGNLSNVFGQAISLAFVAWWARLSPSNWPLGAVLLATACLAHLSSFFMLVAFVGVFLFLARIGGRPTGRSRALAIAAGLGVTAAYYALFVPLILEQAPRLAGTGGGAATSSLSDSVGNQLRDAVLLLGAPALALAWAGRPRADGEPHASLRCWWVAGGLLALLALLTPIEVRYQYALTPAVAIAAAVGVVALWRSGGRRRTLAVVLVALQVGMGSREMVDAFLSRYRIP